MGTTSTLGKRSGPWSSAEKEYIATHCDHVSFFEIAERLRRNPDAVRKFIEKTLNKLPIGEVPINSEMKFEYLLKKSPIWKELKQQFTEQELDLFLYHWRDTIYQFNDDVLATEQLQIIDYIRLEILIHRLGKEQRNNLQELQEFETQLIEAKTQQDTARADLIQTQIGIRRQAQSGLISELTKMLNEKTKIFDKLKATREARIKYLENSKESYISFLQKILTDANLRRNLGIKMEKMRLSMKLVEKKLSEWHIFADGVADKPLLNSDTVGEDNEEGDSDGS